MAPRGAARDRAAAMIDLTKWPEADELIDSALALPAAERAAYVDSVASRDPTLGAALRAVLAEAAGDDGFLDPGGALSGALGGEIERTLGADETQPSLAVGDRIEHYEITGFIGRGGMGEVHRARDLRLDRDVAFKLLPAALRHRSRARRTLSPRGARAGVAQPSRYRRDPRHRGRAGDRGPRPRARRGADAGRASPGRCAVARRVALDRTSIGGSDRGRARARHPAQGPEAGQHQDRRRTRA